jgi:hypothetical protein
MDIGEMTDRLERIVRDDAVAASTRVRAIEVLHRIGRVSTPEDLEWERLVAALGGSDRAE